MPAPRGGSGQEITFGARASAECRLVLDVCGEGPRLYHPSPSLSPPHSFFRLAYTSPPVCALHITADAWHLSARGPTCDARARRARYEMLENFFPLPLLILLGLLLTFLVSNGVAGWIARRQLQVLERNYARVTVGAGGTGAPRIPVTIITGAQHNRSLGENRDARAGNPLVLPVPLTPPHFPALCFPPAPRCACRLPRGREDCPAEPHPLQPGRPAHLRH